MALKFFIVFAYLLNIIIVAADPVNPNPIEPNFVKGEVKYLSPGIVSVFEAKSEHRGVFERSLRTYCYRGQAKTLRRFFESVELQITIDGDDFIQYDGATPEEVREHYEEQRSLFNLNLFSQKRTRLQLSPFTCSCLGMDTIEPYRIVVQRYRVDFWRVMQLLIGILVFQYAAKLSHNSLFYYITGVTFGICSSFMLVIWLSSKLVPRRTVTYGILIGGWTIGLYVLQMLWENLQVILLTYRVYVFWYIIITGILSFFFCYRWGPPRNQRSKNIIKWVLQLMALLMIYFSSQYEEAAAATIIITIAIHYSPRSLWYRIRYYWLRRFPPRRRFMTEEEYHDQGVRETTKALSELRQFARSPNCNQWSVMSRLQDPQRFAAFVQGASHISDDEILHFESFVDQQHSNSREMPEHMQQQQQQQQHHHHHLRSNMQQNIVLHDISEDEETVNYHYSGSSTSTDASRRRLRIGQSASSSAIRNRYSRSSVTPPTSRRSTSRQPSASRSLANFRAEHEYSDEG